jgi:decaprenylphospho-beta-D-erythro-pentofuranosid-2-ulose 2-reductase
LITVNHAGAASASQAVARRLARQGHGTLVVFSSVAAMRPRLFNLPYASSKAGLDAFALGLDHALADTGARVMVVRPGFVHTKMTEGLAPQPLATDTATVADAVIEGLAKGKSVVWAPAALAVAPALRLLPKALWRRLSER